MLSLKFLYTLAYKYFFFGSDLANPSESILQVENPTDLGFIISVKCFIKSELICRYWRQEITFCVTVSLLVTFLALQLTPVEEAMGRVISAVLSHSQRKQQEFRAPGLWSKEKCEHFQISVDIPRILFRVGYISKEVARYHLVPSYERRVLLQMKFSCYFFLLWNSTSFKAGYTVSINRCNLFRSCCWPHCHSAFTKKIFESLLYLQHEDIIVSLYARLQPFSVEVKILKGGFKFRSWTYSFRCAWVVKRYLLTPWSRILLEKLTGFQLVKKFPAFYGTRRFITAFASARHLSLSWAISI